MSSVSIGSSAGVRVKLFVPSVHIVAEPPVQVFAAISNGAVVCVPLVVPAIGVRKDASIVAPVEPSDSAVKDTVIGLTAVAGFINIGLVEIEDAPVRVTSIKSPEGGFIQLTSTSTVDVGMSPLKTQLPTVGVPKVIVCACKEIPHPKAKVKSMPRSNPE